jgi:bifunctional oligoribonuclease and PAP phosphatase NrnA
MYNFKGLYKAIKESDEIVIARHVGPDPDALCSQIALRDSILATFPDKCVYAVGASVAKFKCFGILDKVDYNTLNNPLLIVLDVPNMNRIDGIEEIEYSSIMQIDHHPKEDILAKYEWVDTNKSSTCQMVAELLLNTKLKITKSVAENLFLGIVSDSERFSLKNTSTSTFDVTKKLLDVSKIEFVDLFDRLYMRPLSEHKFIAYITNYLVVDENKFASIIITDETLKEFGVDPSTPSNLINKFNFIEDFYVWCFATEDKKNNQYKISIRSRGPVINKIANKHNGGGHNYASGARIKTREEVLELFKDLSEACQEYEDNKL